MTQVPSTVFATAYKSFTGNLIGLIKLRQRNFIETLCHCLPPLSFSNQNNDTKEITVSARYSLLSANPDYIE